MAVPNIFGNVTTTIPLSQLDQNFATAITLGNTAVYLGNTTTSFGNVTLTNAVLNGTIGATTPSTGAFTTLSSSGIRTSAGNPAFQVDLTTSPTNVTGDGTGYKVAFATENYDVQNNYDTSTFTFTAGTTGKYLFSTYVQLTNIAAGHSSAILMLITSNRNYVLFRGACYSIQSGFGDLGIGGAASVDMDAGDTAYVQLAVYGSTKTITAQSGSYFAGQLVN